jgi:steroid delta-isomerase-like uncharacterized protein
MGGGEMSESTAEVVEQFRAYTMEAWNRSEFDTVDRLFAPDVVVHNTQSGETYEGRDAFKRWVADVRAGFPDFEVDMAETVFVADEDHVASQWIVRGTHDGNLPAVDVEPTHESMELHGVTVYELEDGRVTEAWWHYDNVAFLAQLGIAPEALTA